jgi:hypothetical protein
VNGRWTAAYHGGVIRTAYLRVYLPASAVAGLPPYRLVDDPGKVVQSPAFLWTESLEDDAMYIEWEDRQYVCPRNARLRLLEGMLAFTKANPELGLLSADERMSYAGELAVLRRSSHHAKGHILASAWHVPLRWFGAFHRSERELYDRRGETSIRYRASLGDAVDRVHWSTGVLEAAGFADQVIERVADLERWLASFGADSMVELDYGSAARSFRPADLAFDESAEDVRLSLLALEQGDFNASGEAYERVSRRWADAQSYTYSN